MLSNSDKLQIRQVRNPMWRGDLSKCKFVQSKPFQQIAHGLRRFRGHKVKMKVSKITLFAVKCTMDNTS